ncbi:MAG: cellulase family glycosylhydrolase [Chlorobi bacterium]|nr:cellulase family glycosylhydrolase [Chlorobiota bacterium]
MKIITAFLVCLMIVFGLTANILLAQQIEFIKGADGSVLDEVEQSGGIYFEDGIEKEALTIFKEHGFNTIRLKLWHTPENEYNSLPDVLKMAKRAKEKGYRLMLDIHYSDTWADPGHQSKPAAWEGLPFDVLSDSVYQYTKRVIAAFRDQNTLPDMVQIGNEVSCGMLWDDGRICGSFINPQQWEQFGTLLKQGIMGVQNSLDTGEQVKIIIHFDDGGNNFGCQWFFDNLLAQDVDFDIIGLSFYPWWHGTLSDLEFNLNDLSSRYQKDIIVVEGAYPWTLEWADNTTNIVGAEEQLLPGYPATVEGQKQFLQKIMGIIKNTSGNRGKGFVYWSPEWIPGHPGSPWENLALFDFQGEVLESVRVFEDVAAVSENKNTSLLFRTKCVPNPFRTSATIEFSLIRQADIFIRVIDPLGVMIKSWDLKGLDPGRHTIEWEASEVPAGVYTCIFSTDLSKQKTHILILKQ